METGTPGVKSTQDGWLNRYLHAREHADATPFRAVALTRQLPRSLQGTAPALAMGQIGAVRHPRRAGDRRWCRRRSKREYARGRRSRAERHRRRGVRRDEDAEGRRIRRSISRRTAPSIRARPSARRCRQIAQLIKADVGLEVAFAEAGGWDTHVNQGGAQRPAREPARRLRPRHRGARARSRRPHGGHRHPDDVGVRPRRGGERQPRHRSRPRQRDAGHRRRACAAARSTASGRASRASSATRAATSRHDRLPRCVRRSRRAAPRRRPTPRTIFPGFNGRSRSASSVSACRTTRCRGDRPGRIVASRHGGATAGNRTVRRLRAITIAQPGQAQRPRVIVEDKAAARDPEDADGNLPDCRSARADAHHRHPDTCRPRRAGAAR